MFLSILILAFATFFVHADSSAGAQQPKCIPETFSTATSVSSGFEILSIQAKAQHNFTSIRGGPLQPLLNGLSFCQVHVILTHKGQEDRVLVEIWLPLTLEDWNGRFQATGGAGFATGMFGAHLGAAVKAGWSAASTDGGHDSDFSKVMDASWAIDENKNIKWNLLHNFASRSAVDQIVVGKRITEEYYGTPPRRSYWNGCSTGGRQGYAIAQRYPELLDGILANAPAFNFANLVTAEIVPQILMKEANTYLSTCELEYFRTKAIEKCDMLDGLEDGILQSPEQCDFTPSSIIGEQVSCDGQQVIITSEMAQIVQAIHDGPRDAYGFELFPGLAWGVPMNILASIVTSQDGTRSQNPFPIAASWLRELVIRAPHKDLTHLGSDSYWAIWARAISEFGPLLNTYNPDLSRLRDSGTKLLTWHGLNDAAIPYQNTLLYRRKVEEMMGGTSSINDYYRLFLAPGVGHCGGGMGPQPTDPLTSLVEWVEEGIAPESIDAEITSEDGELFSRQVCAWPGEAKYMGIGNAKRASSWSCIGGPEKDSSAVSMDDSAVHYGAMPARPQKPIQEDKSEPSNRAGEILEGLKDRLESIGLRAT